jgi:hypothetical protein
MSDGNTARERKFSFVRQWALDQLYSIAPPLIVNLNMFLFQSGVPLLSTIVYSGLALKAILEASMLLTFYSLFRSHGGNS